ncbi:uncharacterized protein LOC103696441 [Phoenix dactylifera]|uniref:Uncharacterized protein LOC103696441 n=1 Tax=Phoenix dactylifera TaxID=42345 RepID=A0A8B8IZN0_PHODC|nr:uncharacterized protein LOC103696441 [Phoenix dactylifera]
MVGPGRIGSFLKVFRPGPIFLVGPLSLPRSDQWALFQCPSRKFSGRAGRAGRAKARDHLYSCLNAPTPLRHLTTKERAREAERERLGLISKERQREIDQEKARAKAGGVASEEEPVIMGTPGLDLITLGLVDKEVIPKYDLTVEDGRRLAKEYSRLLMRKHRTRQAAETTLLRLKKEAIATLPDHLWATALVPDLTPFPASRYMATLTPPIEGYIDKVKETAKKHAVKEKLR